MRQCQSTNNNNQNSQLSSNHSDQSPLSDLNNNNSLASSDDQSKSQRIYEILNKDRKFLTDIEEALNLLDGMEKLCPKKSSISLLNPEGNTTERDRLIKQLSDSLINQGYQSAIAYYLRGKLKIDGTQDFEMAKILSETHGNGLTPIQLEYIEFRLKLNKPELPTIAGTQPPMDIWNSHILPYLTAEPYVEIIEEKPSEEQINHVIAKVQPVPDENNQVAQSDPSQQTIKYFKREVDASPTATAALKPIVNAYHLIINKNTQKYSIGFCDKAGKYVTAEVYDKHSLNNYLSANPASVDPNNGSTITRDPELIHYIQNLVRKKKGHTAHPARDAAHFSQVNTANFVLFRPKLQEHAFKELLDAVVRSEYDRVEKVLKSYPELLLSQWKGSVTDKGIAERTFREEETTAFKLAVWAGDWIMWEKMLEAIPSHLKTEYEDDLRQQLLELQKKGLTYTLDNLKACGLRILDAEPSEEIKQDVIKRNAYLFIIDKNNHTCSLGFKDPKTGQYKQCQLDQLSDLKNRTNVLQQALDDHRTINQLPHCIVRDEDVLELARKEIKQFRGQTEIIETSTSHDHTPLSDALQKYNDQYNNWTAPQRKEHWCVVVGWAQRLLSAALWNWWMHSDIDCWNISESTFNKNFPASYRPMLYGNFHIFSLNSSLGDQYAYGAGRIGLWSLVKPDCDALSFLKSFLSSKQSKVKSLMRDLEYHAINSQSPDYLMM